MAFKAMQLSWNGVITNYGKLYYAPESTIIRRPMKDPQKQRIKELEKELENERLKVIAFKKLIEIAEL